MNQQLLQLFGRGLGNSQAQLGAFSSSIKNQHVLGQYSTMQGSPSFGRALQTAFASLLALQLVSCSKFIPNPLSRLEPEHRKLMEQLWKVRICTKSLTAAAFYTAAHPSRQNTCSGVSVPPAAHPQVPIRPPASPVAPTQIASHQQSHMHVIPLMHQALCFHVCPAARATVIRACHPSRAQA